MIKPAMSQPRWDALSGLILLSLVLSPMAVFGRAVSGSHLSASFSLALMAACLLAANLAQGRLHAHDGRALVSVALMPFLFAALLSLLRSPYGLVNIKGWAQIMGIFITVLSAWAVGALSWHRPHFYVALLKIVLGVFAGIGGIAVFQFVVNNLARANVIDFSFLNLIPGEALINEGSMIAGLWRATAIAQEPSHLAVYLSIAGGIALLRLGLAGRQLSQALIHVMNLPSALLIVGGVLASLSSIGGVALIATAGSLRLFIPKLKIFRLLVFIGLLFSVGTVLAVRFIDSQSEFVTKILSVSIVAQAAQGKTLDQFQTQDVTAIALATNFYVMQENIKNYPFFGVGIGSHPLAFESSDMSLFEVVPKDILFLNSQDAASFLIRILSEMGWVGLAGFLISITVICLVLRREIIRLWSFSKHDPRFVTFVAIGVGLSASIVGLTIVSLMRFSLYYGAPLWVAIVLAAGLPTLYAKPPNRNVAARVPKPVTAGVGRELRQ